MSIIIPVYNAENYLRECLNSILEQTLQNIEIICVNDGSTDSSKQLLKEYEDRFNNILVIEQENQGAAIARNTGIRAASGQFICFMDADDFYPDSTILQNLYEGAVKNHVKICGGSFCSLIEGNIITDYYEKNEGYVFRTDSKIKYEDYQWDWGFTRFCYELKMLKDNDIYFPERTYYEDPPFLVKAMICAGDFYAVAQITYCYREAYKLRNLSETNLTDMLEGVLDILAMAEQKQLWRLEGYMRDRIEVYKLPLYNQVVNGNKKMEALLKQINKKLNVYALQKAGLIPYFLGVLDDVQKAQEIENQEKEFLAGLKQFDKIIIYGAGEIGKKLSAYFKASTDIKIDAFAVSDLHNNPARIYGIPVNVIGDFFNDKEQALILIGTAENKHEEIKKFLQELGFLNIWPIDYKKIERFTMR